jgi:hypothetical protein
MTSLSSHSTWWAASRKSLPRLRKLQRNLLHKEISELSNPVQVSFLDFSLYAILQLGSMSWSAIFCRGMLVFSFLFHPLHIISNCSDIDFGCTRITCALRNTENIKIWHLGTLYCLLKLLSFVMRLVQDKIIWSLSERVLALDAGIG